MCVPGCLHILIYVFQAGSPQAMYRMVGRLIRCPAVLPGTHRLSMEARKTSDTGTLILTFYGIDVRRRFQGLLTDPS